jgi:hypothetical protein
MFKPDLMFKPALWMLPVAPERATEHGSPVWLLGAPRVAAHTGSSGDRRRVNWGVRGGLGFRDSACISGLNGSQGALRGTVGVTAGRWRTGAGPTD